MQQRCLEFLLDWLVERIVANWLAPNEGSIVLTCVDISVLFG